MLITAAKASEAAEVLAVSLEGLTAEILSKAYRNAAKTCHPDQHGAEKLQLWARVSWAKEVLERWLKTRPAEEVPMTVNGCRACDGKGRVPIKSNGFGKPMTMLCVLCDGRGEVLDEKQDEMEG